MAHISVSGIEEDDDGFEFVTCECGFVVGPCPDMETLIDSAMSHASGAGYREGLEG